MQRKGAPQGALFHSSRDDYATSGSRPAGCSSASSAGVATALVSASPPILITAVAGLAVLGALVTSITTALEEPAHRITAIVTFLVTASEISIIGIGSAFWGLLVGAIFMLWMGWKRRSPKEAIVDN